MNDEYDGGVALEDAQMRSMRAFLAINPH